MKIKIKIKRIILLLVLFVGVVSMSGDAAVHAITSQGKRFVLLNHIAPHYSMKLSEPSKKRIQLKNTHHTLEFETNGRRFWINGTLIWLNKPIQKIGWHWAVEEIDFFKTIDPVVRPQAFLKNRGNRIVILDPGHGGEDKGAESPRRVYEKLLVMDIAKRVQTHLKEKRIQVCLTRSSDRFISLSDRTKKAAEEKADLFISIHADSAGATKSANGVCVFMLSLPGHYSTGSYGKNVPSSTVYSGNRFNAANIVLAYRIQQNIIKATSQTDRGAKRARFQVLRKAPCPAVLIETAFLSNPKEEAMVINPDGRKRIARGIANGIFAYLNDIYRAKKK